MPVARRVLAPAVAAAAACVFGLAGAAGPPGPAAEVSPPDPTVLTRSFALIREGRTAEARSLLEPVVAQHPNWGRAHFHLALSWHEEHRYALARPEFERAIALDPSYRPAKLFYGWCLYYLGELDRSREAFQAYLAGRPDDADARFALGLIALDRDDAGGARTSFEQAIALAQQQNDLEVEAKAQVRLADALLRLDAADGLTAARRALERATELEPRRPEAWFKLSRVLARLGEQNASRTALAKSQTLRAEAGKGEAANDRKPLE